MTKKTAHQTTESQEQADKTEPTCFVIMPIADMSGYDTGHFGRVYEHLLKPAIMAAGYKPLRADDTSKTDYIVVGIIQKIVESEMVICDLSGRNANVMYELGIRHAFNKPVVLIKDIRTEKVFDIQGLRYTQYDESLRIDSVQKNLSSIEQSITETAKAESRDLNSIVKLAGIHTAELPNRTEISADTQIILSAIRSIDTRINKLESLESEIRDPSLPEKMLMSNGQIVEIGTHVYSKQFNISGKVYKLNLRSRKMYIQTDDGSLLNIPFETPVFQDLKVGVP